MIVSYLWERTVKNRVDAVASHAVASHAIALLPFLGFPVAGNMHSSTMAMP